MIKKWLFLLLLMLCSVAFAAEAEELYSVYKLAEESEAYTVSAEYPQIKWEKLPASDREAVNLEIKKFWEESWLKEIKALGSQDKAMAKEMKKIGTAVKADKKINFEITFLKPDFLSIKFENYKYEIGYAHGLTTVCGFNYDFKNKKVLKLDDLFKKDSNYQEWLDDYLEKDIKRQRKLNNPELDLETQAIKTGETEPREFEIFGIMKEGLVFYFSDYDVASYAEGRMEVFIPFNEIENFLKDDIAKRLLNIEKDAVVQENASPEMNQ